MGADQGTRVRAHQRNRAGLIIIGCELTREPGSELTRETGSELRILGWELTREPGSELTRETGQSSPEKQGRPQDIRAGAE